jgi:hypothetical protein
MTYAIELLEKELAVLNQVYNSFISTGYVKADGKPSLENRRKANELKQAIQLLKNG